MAQCLALFLLFAVTGKSPVPFSVKNSLSYICISRIDFHLGLFLCRTACLEALLRSVLFVHRKLLFCRGHKLTTE